MQSPEWRTCHWGKSGSESSLIVSGLCSQNFFAAMPWLVEEASTPSSTTTTTTKITTRHSFSGIGVVTVEIIAYEEERGWDGSMLRSFWQMVHVGRERSKVIPVRRMGRDVDKQEAVVEGEAQPKVPWGLGGGRVVHRH